MEIIQLFFAAVFGLIFGSFFNVLIWRIPRNESIVRPASHCPGCGHLITPLENIPVFSYLFLRGRCSHCKTRISAVYPVIEVITAVVAVVLWKTLILPSWSPSNWMHNVNLVLQCAVLLLMIPITFIDLRHTIIPDAFTLPFLAAGLAASFLPGDTTPLQSLSGILAGGGALIGIGWIGSIIFRKEDAMGGGDIKMLAMIGAFWGPKTAFLTIMFGSILGSLFGIALIAMQKLGQDHRIPFGPYLAVGLFITIFRGDRIVDAYMSFVSSLFFR